VYNQQINNNIEYPKVKNFQPSSISHCFYNGQNIINVRYINYQLLENGNYYYPDNTGIIKNINFVSHLNENLEPEFGFTMMRENNVGLLTNESAFSKGLEDIRIFESGGKLKFIATTVGYSNNGMNSMVIGDYDDVFGEFKNGKIIETDFGSVCEKNWIPVGKPTVSPTLCIYSWNPFRIGEIHDNKMTIIDEYFLTPLSIFEKVRGSTLFLDWRENLVGVVHFSENHSPRYYFHMLVILDKNTYRPLSFSQPFRFYKECGIEFCIGFTIHNCMVNNSNSNNFYFWVSHFDRNPCIFVLSEQEIENLFII
jgi:hypothetical protein